MAVYAALIGGVIVGYAAAWFIVRRDPTGKDGALERGGPIALIGLAVLAVIILIAEAQVQDMAVKLALRDILIVLATAAFTAVASCFLMYAKNDPD